MQYTRTLFLRLLGAIYCCAFLSLAIEIRGLIGSRGILPAADFLRAVAQHYGRERYALLPTLAWIDAGDAALVGFAVAGTLLAALAVWKPLQPWLFAALWILYLSLDNIGRSFLMFQWDALLLETGFLAIWYARAGNVPVLVTWLLRVLLCKLMFLSGLVKLTSGDTAWRSLTALTVHYETQPLPMPLAWYAHQLPAWLHKFSAAAMFAIELGLPLLIFTPRKVRFAAAGGFAFFQTLILLTGNYTFFNWLTLALCLLLLDDAAFGRSPEAPERPRVLDFAPALLIAASFFLPWFNRLQIYNSYGLFAVMTMTRPEIVIEGSNDAIEWFAYEFRYKPGDVRRAPAVIAPLQPRLDWQMWFAALGSHQQSPWFQPFLRRILEGSPDVLALLAGNPFPKAPPLFIRAQLYEYHFTGRNHGGAWWRRDYKGVYFPAASLGVM